MTILDSVMSS